MNDPEPAKNAAIVIGASVGAVEALLAILPGLPADFAVPVLVVVHVPADRRSLLATLFADRCQMEVKEAEDKEALSGGTIYFAPADYHLLVEPDFSISLSNDDPVLFSRPSIDVLFQSAADAYGDGLIGVVLTGANSDGAKGLAAICAAGGRAIVQTPASAEGKAMPVAALAACPTAASAEPSRIAALLEHEISRL